MAETIGPVISTGPKHYPPGQIIAAPIRGSTGYLPDFSSLKLRNHNNGRMDGFAITIR
jgi:hypothetical protein